MPKCSIHIHVGQLFNVKWHIKNTDCIFSQCFQEINIFANFWLSANRAKKRELFMRSWEEYQNVTKRSTRSVPKPKILVSLKSNQQQRLRRHIYQPCDHDLLFAPFEMSCRDAVFMILRVSVCWIAIATNEWRTYTTKIGIVWIFAFAAYFFFFALSLSVFWSFVFAQRSQFFDYFVIIIIRVWNVYDHKKHL